MEVARRLATIQEELAEARRWLRWFRIAVLTAFCLFVLRVIFVVDDFRQLREHPRPHPTELILEKPP